MYYQMHITRKKFILFSLGIFAFLLTAHFWSSYMVKPHGVFDILNTCGMKKYFHIYCPGCGGTRAVSALFHLHLWQSLCCHPLVLYTVFFFTKSYLRVFLLIIKGSNHFDMQFQTWPLWLALILIVIFFIGRNALLICGIFDYLGDLSSFYM